MTETIVTQNKLKKIEDLTSPEIGMIYSLSRTGWSYREIGRRYRISETDARTVVDNYVEVRKACERKAFEESPNGNPKQEPAKEKSRKRRSDAIYATAKDRQAAFRAKLREKRHAAVEQRSASGVADPTSKAEEELSVTLCEGTTLEVTREACPY